MNVCQIEAEVQGDGKRAYLPHPIFQTTLFAAVRERQKNEYRKRSVTLERTNRWGDVLTIRSARTLFAMPDMGVFLATVALIQKHGFHDLIDGVTGETVGRVRSMFPIGELYDLTGMGRSSARDRLLISLETLGSVSVSVKYAKTPDSMERHRYSDGFHMASFWDMNIISRKGRSGSLVEIFPSKYLIPNKRSLWADAKLCNSLKTDTSRVIFWNLICRQHLRASIHNWKKLVGSEAERVDKWRARQLMPAVEELAAHGYYIEEGDGEILICRPGSSLRLTKKAGEREM